MLCRYNSNSKAQKGVLGAEVGLDAAQGEVHHREGAVVHESVEI